jgi:hypothetical protein
MIPARVQFEVAFTIEQQLIMALFMVVAVYGNYFFWDWLHGKIYRYLNKRAAARTTTTNGGAPGGQNGV